MLTSVTKTKNNNKKDKINLKKYILGILYFIIFFVAYYFVIGIISLISMFFISKTFASGLDFGLWAYALVIGFAIAPILSFITTVKVIKNI